MPDATTYQKILKAEINSSNSKLRSHALKGLVYLGDINWVSILFI